MCFCVCMCVHTCRDQKIMVEVGSLCPSCGSQDWTQITKLCGKFLYSWSSVKFLRILYHPLCWLLICAVSMGNGLLWTRRPPSLSWLCWSLHSDILEIYVDKPLLLQMLRDAPISHTDYCHQAALGLGGKSPVYWGVLLPHRPTRLSEGTSMGKGMIRNCELLSSVQSKDFPS